MNSNHFLSTNAHWLLRTAIVSVFLYHDTLKFSNLDGFAQILPISYLEIVLIALAQVGGSFLIIVGGFSKSRLADIATRIGAALNIPVMIGAIALVHWGRWNFIANETHPLGGIEFQTIMALLMLYVVLRIRKIRSRWQPHNLELTTYDEQSNQSVDGKNVAEHYFFVRCSN